MGGRKHIKKFQLRKFYYFVIVQMCGFLILLFAIRIES